jgi:predicted nucleic acid-binding protein
LTRYLLDTNIISELVRPRPAPAVVAWISDQRDDELHIATMTLAELRRGVLQKPLGRGRRELEAWFEGPDGPGMMFAGRVLAFDERAASIWGRLMAEGTLAGRPRSGLDMVIAATGLANDCRIVTANERHFEGLDAFNPLKAA